MADKRQLLRIKLREDYYFVQRIGEQGERIGKPTKWKIEKRSSLPRELFFKTCGFIGSRIKRCDERSLVDLKRATLRALHEAAAAYGCASKSGCDCGDIAWYLDGEPFVAWQIHQETLDKQRASKLRKSRAALRWIVVLRESGYFRMRPRRTRRYWMLNEK